MNDLEQARAIGGGDEATFTKYYQENLPDWEHLASSICHNVELRQVAMGRFKEEILRRSCRTFKGRSSLKTYLLGTLRELCQKVTWQYDLEQARLIAGGDENAFTTYYLTNLPYWESVASAICFDTESREEALGKFKEAIIKNKCRDFNGGSSLKTYLSRALRFKCFDVIRSKTREVKLISIEEVGVDSPHLARRDPREFITCEDLFKQGLKRLHAELDPLDRFIWELRLRGVTQVQIARILKKSEVVVSQHVKKICNRLANILEELAEGPYGDCEEYFFSVARMESEPSNATNIQLLGRPSTETHHN